MEPHLLLASPELHPLVQKARTLVPVLKERASVTDELRRIPDETIADLHDAGFFRMFQPSRWGGLEVDPAVYFEVQMTLAEGCASTAWVQGVVGVHSWQLALFPLEAQQEVWGTNARTLISSSYAPTGQIERVEGGFRVKGRWSFSSGSDHCDWVFLGGLAPSHRDPNILEMFTFLLPRRDYRIDDTWHVAGLKGTGSKDIVVEGAFVPAHRTHRMLDGFRQSSPGNALNPAPLFRLPFGQVFVRSVSTTAIGVARGALASFREVAARRVSAADKSKVAEEQQTQRVIARSSARVEEVRRTLLANFNELMEAVRSGSELDLERRLKFRYDSSEAVERCVEVVDDLFTASGGRAIFLGHPLLRAFMDIHAARAHYANNPDKPCRNWGGVQLGLKNADYFL